jgi:3'(2'), 5'-bisphosphate nucleotidase
MLVCPRGYTSALYIEGNLAVPFPSEDKEKIKNNQLWGYPPENIGLPMNFVEMMGIFRRLALEAGDLIMTVYDGPDFDVKSKSDTSPVTIADEAADALISAGLRAAFPDVVLITEEQAASHALTAKTFFIVDPLDGTKEFIQRRGDFTVNIAYVENGIPVRGVVYAPAQGRLFYTLADGTAVEETAGKEFGDFAKEAPGLVTPITVSTPDNTSLMVVASKSHRDAATDDYIAKYAVKDMKSAGSSLKFCLLATGEADLYPRLGRTMEWDTAAGDAVLRGAGGHVVRFDDHSVLTYGKAGWDNPFFIAYAPGVVLFK